MKIVHVVGARPNFMKIAPVMKAVARAGFAQQKLVHTGQHYDVSMSDVFFSDLGMPLPDIHLGVGSGSHAEQTAKVMVGFESVCAAEKPDLVVVAGDVNSTLACALVAKKLGIRVAHVEAGLRSRDMTMPEEVNRVVTDAISDFLFVTECSGVDNLLAEGKPRAAIHHVGHVMVDNLMHQCDRLADTDTSRFVSTGLKTRLGRYGVVTLHRPVDGSGDIGVGDGIDDPGESRHQHVRLGGASRDCGQQRRHHDGREKEPTGPLHDLMIGLFA